MAKMLRATQVDYVLRDDEGKVGVRFENLSIELPKHKITSLLGSSGCGKSTLVRILGGLVPPTQGKVLCEGELVRQPESPVTVVFQDYTAAVFPWMTVRENLKLGLRKRSMSGTEQPTVPDIADLLEIESLLETYPSQLSGGERQRVQLARALLTGAEYLLLDEPSSSLDLELRRTLLELLGSAIDEYDMGILLITHNIDEAVYVSDRLYLGRKNSRGCLILEEMGGFSRDAEDLGDAHNSSEYNDLYNQVYHSLFGGTE